MLEIIEIEKGNTISNICGGKLMHKKLLLVFIAIIVCVIGIFIIKPNFLFSNSSSSQIDTKNFRAIGTVIDIRKDEKDDSIIVKMALRKGVMSVDDDLYCVNKDKKSECKVKYFLISGEPSPMISKLGKYELVFDKSYSKALTKDSLLVVPEDSKIKNAVTTPFLTGPLKTK